MRSKRPWLAFVLAASFPASGCAHTHFAGEYRPVPNDVVHRGDHRVLAKGSEWLFFWGLLDTGHFDVNSEMRRSVRDKEAITDLDVKDRLSIGGLALWIITAGIISHHTIVVKGSPAEIRHEPPPVSAPPAGYVPPPRTERETIIVTPSRDDANPPKKTDEDRRSDENR